MKEIKIKANSIEDLNKVRLVLNKDIPCYRICAVEIFNYKSETPLELFINRLSYIPLSGQAVKKEYLIKTTGQITGQLFNKIIMPFYMHPKLSILNEGQVSAKITIEKGTAASHSCFNTIDSQEWDYENKILTVIPNTNYQDNAEIKEKIKALIQNNKGIVLIDNETNNS